MSSFSSSKRLLNDIALCEENSDRKIPSEKYYVVHIKIEKDQDVTSIAKTILKTENALAAYVYQNEIYLLFSSVEKKGHNLGGSHQKICSDYASKISIETTSPTMVKIVELESRTMIMIYFQTKVFENAKRSALCLSKNKITKKEINQFTFSEIIPLLESRSTVVWANVSPNYRFGTFYKYVKTSKTEKFVTIAELINMKDLEKYSSYFFE